MNALLFSGWDLLMWVIATAVVTGGILWFIFDWVHYNIRLEEMAFRMKNLELLGKEDEE
jgi:hypothetical protein